MSDWKNAHYTNTNLTLHTPYTHVKAHRFPISSYLFSDPRGLFQHPLHKMKRISAPNRIRIVSMTTNTSLRRSRRSRRSASARTPIRGAGTHTTWRRWSPGRLRHAAPSPRRTHTEVGLRWQLQWSTYRPDKRRTCSSERRRSTSFETGEKSFSRKPICFGTAVPQKASLSGERWKPG